VATPEAWIVMLKRETTAASGRYPGPSRALSLAVLAVAIALAGGGCAPEAKVISVESLLRGMVDFQELAREPQPLFTEATSSSFSRESHKGGDAWFDNRDVGQYVRTETNDGRTEHVLADLTGPGTITRFWSANPTLTNSVRFYFDGEEVPRLECPLEGLFSGRTEPFGPEFSYVSGTGGNLYFPLPYWPCTSGTAPSRSATITCAPSGER
jgi:hypothetical protein